MYDSAPARDDVEHGKSHERVSERRAVVTHDDFHGERLTEYRGVNVILERGSKKAKDPQTIVSRLDVSAVEHREEHGQPVQIERCALIQLSLERKERVLFWVET